MPSQPRIPRKFLCNQSRILGQSMQINYTQITNGCWNPVCANARMTMYRFSSQVARRPRRRRHRKSPKNGHGQCSSMGALKTRPTASCGGRSPPRRWQRYPCGKGSPPAMHSSVLRPLRRRKRPRAGGPCRWWGSTCGWRWGVRFFFVLRQKESPWHLGFSKYLLIFFR